MEQDSGPSGEKAVAMRIAGKDVAGLREDRNGGDRRIDPQWFTFVSVLDVVSSVGRAIQFGGQVLREVSGHSEDGLVAMVKDPLGAAVGLWQPGSRIGARLGLELNTMCWTELVSCDPAASAQFYTGLFGWTVREENGYLEYLLADTSQAGMVPAQSAVGSQWGVYFRVSDCDATASRASNHGGSVLVPPTDIPGVGRFCRLSDPLGAVFSVIRLRED
jgi:predicted enzyme related to lactoylglutathione lyase